VNSIEKYDKGMNVYNNKGGAFERGLRKCSKSRGKFGREENVYMVARGGIECL
jgi:hypothetical protein